MGTRAAVAIGFEPPGPRLLAVNLLKVLFEPLGCWNGCWKVLGEVVPREIGGDPLGSGKSVTEFTSFPCFSPTQKNCLFYLSAQETQVFALTRWARVSSGYHVSPGLVPPIFDF